MEMRFLFLDSIFQLILWFLLKVESYSLIASITVDIRGGSIVCGYKTFDMEFTLNLLLLAVHCKGELQVRPELDQGSGLDPSRFPQG